MSIVITKYTKIYRKNDRQIQILSVALLVFLCGVFCCAGWLLSLREYKEAIGLLPIAGALLSTLVAIRIANRVLLSNQMTHEDNRRHEVVKVTHHLIAVTKDIRAKVNYLKTCFEDANVPNIALLKVLESIEARYELYWQSDIYKYLPGPCIDIITEMSGNIFGMNLFAEGVRISAAPTAMLSNVPRSMQESSLIPALSQLIEEIQKLLDCLYELRRSLDHVESKS